MTLTSMHLAGAILAAIAIIAAVLLTAPNLKVGTARLAAIVKITCVTVAGTGYLLAVGMLVWGVVIRSEGLMYFSMVPLVLAIMTSKFMHRHGI